MNFEYIPLSKIFPIPCMFLPLLCLGTILEPTCPASCQPSCSPPPVWVHRGGLVPPLLLYDSPCAVLRRGPRSFTIRVGSGDKVVAISRLKACMAADATPGSLRRRGRPLDSHPSSLTASKRVSFSDPLVLRLLLHRRCHATVLEPFSYPARRFLHARDRRRLHSLHKHGTRPMTVQRPRGWTSDLFSSQPRPELGGALWRAVYAPGYGQTSPAYSSQSVQYLFINHLLSLNKLVLVGRG
jgi:hypothetical protein